MIGEAWDGIGHAPGGDRRRRRRLWLASLRRALGEAALAVRAIDAEGVETTDAAGRIADALDAVAELDARLGHGIDGNGS